MAATTKSMKPRRVRAERFVTCPFCGYRGIHTGNPGRWCAGCHVKYRESADGEWIIFDPQMRARSMGEAWAIAISKSGGARLGEKK